jgi:hypothetical protein
MSLGLWNGVNMLILDNSLLKVIGQVQKSTVSRNLQVGITAL